MKTSICKIQKITSTRKITKMKTSVRKIQKMKTTSMKKIQKMITSIIVNSENDNDSKEDSEN